MKRSEKNILIGLLLAVIFVGIIAISIVQYQANNTAETSVYLSATARQQNRNLDRLETQRAMTPDG